MSINETLTLAAYFFVLVILAVYGWHRYYLVYLYMKNKDRQPKPGPPLDPLPVVTIQLPLYNEMYVADRLIDAVCRIEYPREQLEIQVLDDSTDETGSIAELAVRRYAAQGFDIKYIHRDEPHRLQGRRARSGPQGRARRVHRDLRRRLHPVHRFPAAHGAVLHRRPKVAMVQARWGHINQDYSLLTKIQSILLDGHFVLEHGGRNRAGPLLQLQRHRRHLAPRGDRRRRRLAARHADRGSRPQLPRAAARLAVRLRARSHRAGRSAGRDERVQVAAAPLGEGVDPDVPQAAAADPARRICRSAVKAEAFFHLTANFNYPLMVRAVGADVPVDGHPLQHGLVRDAAHRRAAVLRGDVFGLQLLHGLPARAARRLARAHPVPAVPDVDRHRPVHQQHAGRVRGAVQQAVRVRADAEVPHRRRAPTSGSARSTASRSPCSRSSSSRSASTSRRRCSTRWPTGSTARLPFLVLFQVGFLYTGLLSIVQQYAGDSDGVGAELQPGGQGS